MANFSSDGGSGTADPVYLQVDGQGLLMIFPLSYQAKTHCALLGSPSETGRMQYDNKVVQPTEVNFTGVVKYAYRHVVERIVRHVKEVYSLGNLMCTLHTKSGTYKNLIVESFEEKGDSHRYDGIEVSAKLQEYLEHS